MHACACVCACTGEVKWLHPPSQSLAQEHCTLSDQLSSSPPLSLVSVHWPSLYCPCPSHQPARQHLPPELYLIWGCVSKPLTSESIAAWTGSDAQGEDLTRQWPGADLHLGTFVHSHHCRGSEIVTKQNTQPGPGFTAPWSLCSNTSKCCLWPPLGPLPMGTSYGLYLRCSQ